MFKERIISAALLIPIAFVLLYLGGWWFVALVALFVGIAGHEAYAMLRRKGYTPFEMWGIGISLAFLLLSVVFPTPGWMTYFITGAVIVTLVRALAQRTEAPATDWALTLGVALYLGVLAHYAPLLRARPRGFWWVVVALGLTWITDSGAFFIGTAVGKHRMAPRLSPKKTWEGTIGGGVVGVLAAVALVPLVLPAVSVGQSALLGAAVATMAPLGDLVESMFKRQCGVKDSGHLIPGHGGALDRIDSLLFVFPTVYWFSLLWG